MVSGFVLRSLVQSNIPCLLIGICLYDYGFSFRNVRKSDKERGVEAAGLESNEYYVEYVA